MRIDEFTDTYSDDIIYLREARTALLTHPLRVEIPSLCNASLCRLYVIVMIGSIEAMLERWKERDTSNILESYFTPDRVSNAVRLERLSNAFSSKGINVNPAVFDDYLAIKYLRNAIVHANWQAASGEVKQQQIDWLVSRGFPADSRDLKEEHWQKLEWVNENMMLYIAISGIADIRPDPDKSPVGVGMRKLPDTRGILENSDFRRMYWGNLERVDAAIYEVIEVAAVHPEFSWTNGLTHDELNGLSREAQKYRFYQSAHVAAAQGFKPLTDIAGYADNAVQCWNEYVRLVPEFEELGRGEVKDALLVFQAMRDGGLRAKGGMIPPWQPHTPVEIIEELSKLLFENTGELAIAKIAEALYLGAKAKRAMQNITPLSVFSIKLPIIAPSRKSEFAETADHMADVFELGIAWDDFMQSREFKNEIIQFYRKMSLTLGVADESSGAVATSGSRV
jgi:hypothetical protein